MNTATLNTKSSPRRILTAREAADYCGLPHHKFSIICRVAPIQFHGVQIRYDMRDLDEWLDGLKSGNPTGEDDIIWKLG
jgi:hypothetical protein